MDWTVRVKNGKWWNGSTHDGVIFDDRGWGTTDYVSACRIAVRCGIKQDWTKGIGVVPGPDEMAWRPDYGEDGTWIPSPFSYWATNGGIVPHLPTVHEALKGEKVWGTWSASVNKDGRWHTHFGMAGNPDYPNFTHANDPVVYGTYADRDGRSGATRLLPPDLLLAALDAEKPEPEPAPEPTWRETYGPLAKRVEAIDRACETQCDDINAAMQRIEAIEARIATPVPSLDAHRKLESRVEALEARVEEVMGLCVAEVECSPGPEPDSEGWRPMDTAPRRDGEEIEVLFCEKPERIFYFNQKWFNRNYCLGTV